MDMRVSRRGEAYYGAIKTGGQTPGARAEACKNHLSVHMHLIEQIPAPNRITCTLFPSADYELRTTVSRPGIAVHCPA